MGLGIALYSSGKYEEAMKALSAAADLAPSDSRPYLFLARAYTATVSQTEGVTARLRYFAEREPENSLALFGYALVLWKETRGDNGQPNWEQAKSLLEKSVSLDPEFADGHFQLGILYAEQERNADAIREFEKAIAIEPNLASAHYHLGQTHMRAKDVKRAKEEFETYEQLRHPRERNSQDTTR
jgi:tetratricopeptide (TPR) repeat protein